MENRITYIEIAGTKYPLNFSVRAAKVVIERYGGLEKLADVLDNKTEAELFDELMFLLSLLLDQGAKYKKLIDNEEVRTFTQEELEIVMGTMDCVKLQNTLIHAMAAGGKQSMELKEPSKNGETTQGQ